MAMRLPRAGTLHRPSRLKAAREGREAESLGARRQLRLPGGAVAVAGRPEPAPKERGQSGVTLAAAGPLGPASAS
jgi:hypothetical protein